MHFPCSTPHLPNLPQDLEKQLEGAESSLMENSDRIKIMDEHLNNVQQELKYTQTRVSESWHIGRLRSRLG